MTTTTAYLAGPMRGIPFWNAPAFDQAAATLRNRGYDVLNPCDLDRAEFDVDFSLYPTGTEEIPGLPPLHDLLLRDLLELAKCDCIILLPGHERSKGARTEKSFAEFCGLRVLYFTPQDGSLWSIPEKDCTTND